MSQAFKCDRCGDQIHPPVAKVQSWRKFRFPDWWGCSIDDPHYTDGDICRDCFKQFDRFMDGKAVEALTPHTTQEGDES